MKTIAFVTNNYTPYSGGVVSSIDATAHALRGRGYTVFIIAPDFLGDRHIDPPHVIRLPSLYRFMYKQNHMMIPWKASFYLNRALEKMKPVLVHVHHPFLLGVAAVAWARERGIKTVFTYHTLYEQYLHYVPLPGWLIQPWVQRRVRTFCRMVDHVIVPSSGVYTLLRAQGIEHTAIIPSGLQSFFLDQPFLSKKLAAPYQLLYVGRLVKEKNVALLFDLMAQLPDSFELTVVGYGEYEKQLQEYAYTKLALPKSRVRFVMKPDKHELRASYQQAHLFLFPSQSDTQGLVLAESMASSTPVIALDGIGQRDIVVHGQNGFLVGSLDEMRTTIIALSNDQSRYASMQHAAWKTACAYNPERLIEKLITVYRL